jgi:predicted ATPase
VSLNPVNIVLLASVASAAGADSDGPCAGSVACDVLDLQDLSERKTAALLRVRFADSTSADADAMYALTRGIPGLIRERCDHVSGLAGMPELLCDEVSTRGLSERAREMLERRLHGLPDGALDVLRVAAVLGSRFRPARLAEICDQPADPGRSRSATESAPVNVARI